MSNTLTLAQQLVASHGDRAHAVINRLARDLAEEGDDAAAAFWLRVAEAAIALQSGR